jgi:hypothetical protein
MSRRRSTSPFSLFSFQDIITSVTGIMILVTLMLTIELLHRKETSPAAKSAEIAERLKDAVDRNRCEAERLDREIEELRRELARAQTDILHLAAFDPNRVAAQITNLNELTAQLEAQLGEVRAEQTAAELRRRAAVEEQARRANDPQTLEELLAEVRNTQEQLQRMRKSNRVIYNAAEGAAKRPWLIELSAAEMLVAPAGAAARAERFTDLAAFRDWLRQRDAGGEYFVLLVKPAGIDRFARTLDTLRQLRFDVGFDLLAENQTAVDPHLGAAAP